MTTFQVTLPDKFDFDVAARGMAEEWHGNCIDLNGFARPRASRATKTRPNKSILKSTQWKTAQTIFSCRLTFPKKKERSRRWSEQNSTGILFYFLFSRELNSTEKSKDTEKLLLLSLLAFSTLPNTVITVPFTMKWYGTESWLVWETSRYPTNCGVTPSWGLKRSYNKHA